MDYGQSWSSQEWKSEATAHDRSGKPDEISWNAMQQVCPHHERPLLDGKTTFVMGSDAAELVNKVKDQVRRKRQNVERCRFWRRAFNNLGECSWLRR